MQKIKLFLFLMLFNNTVMAQPPWEIQLDAQNFAHLDRIFFLDKDHGWAIGGFTIGTGGPYYFTSDGGQNWYLGDWWNIQGVDIAFVNQDTGFIAASNGIILKTVDGGNNWVDIQTPAQYNLSRLFFRDEYKGWATIDNQSDTFQLVHTIDGGNSWEPQQVFDINTSGIYSIYFINDSIGFGGGAYIDMENDDHYTAIVKTENGGEDWNISYLSQNTFYAINDIYFYNPFVGWAVGQKSSYTYLILKTTDGGETWEEQIIEDYPPEKVNCAYFINDSTGWLGGTESYSDYGIIYATNDGGETWYAQENFMDPIYDIQMLNRDTGWAVGGDFIYYTTDGSFIVGDDEIQPIGIGIYPNPAHGKFNLSIPAEYQGEKITIVDIQGRIVKELSFPVGNTIIDISSQPEGIYFLNLEYRFNKHIHSLTEKIIKL
ncbi:MAG: T9SS type A sorting domain-containing protein [Bacteroidales bacterium]|nr:T9SS type A sorting domain-containing protein [Bacteroidales bacterium]